MVKIECDNYLCILFQIKQKLPMDVFLTDLTYATIGHFY